VSAGLKLIVGLGNPGVQYEKTRHNAGFWFVDGIADRLNVHFRPEAAFQGELARLEYGGNTVLLLKPATYMNHSGRSVGSVLRYFKINPAEMLVAHDELEFLPGVVRLKVAGGHGGHNGIRDTIAQTGSADFARLRIGIGRPLDKSRVSQYVLENPGKTEAGQIASAIDRVMDHAGAMLDGHMQKVMNSLNAV
jgi:PTH1 family peptidyl-tRNA hydrolase